LKDRLDRASVFCDYLDTQWQSLKEMPLAFSWLSVKYALRKDIDYVTGKVSVREDVSEKSE
jgi:hypothetical protein